MHTPPGNGRRRSLSLFARPVALAAWMVALCLFTGCGGATPTPAAVPPTATPILYAGTVSGYIQVQPGHAAATDALAVDLYFEDTTTGRVVVIPLEPGQHEFAVAVPEGTYLLYAWLSDFSLKGAHAVCQSGEDYEDPLPQPVVVTAGETISGVDIDKWAMPEGSPLVLIGTLVDGTGAEPLPDAAVVIREDRIVAVGLRSDLTIPPQAEVINLRNATILPSFINTHVHNAYQGRNLSIWAREGVTTVRDLGERFEFPYFTTRDRLCTDLRRAWLIAAGPLVTVPGGYPIAGNNFASLTVTSPEDARQKIDQLIDDGADVIKITLTSGGAPSLSAEEAAAIVETAHQRGIPVSAHATQSENVGRALDAGVDDIAHIATDRVPDAVLQRMVAADVSWVPTLEAMEGRGRDNLRRFVEAGGRVALGNDAGYLQGLEIGMPMREIEWMQKAGMTPMQIIVAATRNAAYVCNREGTLGTLEAGKFADVLVVDGDPLRDLEALANVRLVIHRGEIIRSAP
jgi:imidazolonepropionase-like amidohydrolase